MAKEDRFSKYIWLMPAIIGIGIVVSVAVVIGTSKDESETSGS